MGLAAGGRQSAARHLFWTGHVQVQQLLDAFFLLTPETFGEEARVEILG